MQRLRFHVPIGDFILSIPEVGIYKRKQESKKERKHVSTNEATKKKRKNSQEKGKKTRS